MEDEAVRRAVEGVPRPVFYQGQIVGAVQEYSDELLIRMLKARNCSTGGENGPAG